MASKGLGSVLRCGKGSGAYGLRCGPVALMPSRLLATTAWIPTQRPTVFG